MPEIALSLIRSNPFRDFDLHPIDPDQVARLRASIDADGFWASVVARKVSDGYEIAFGHHRVDAARGAGLTHIPIEVRELSDWQMVRMLASENATQRGSTAAAALDAIAAISRVLAFGLLRWDEARFFRNMKNITISYPECRGRLEAGSGIGRDCIIASTAGFTTSQVDTALGTLKDSGLMANIIAEARVQADVELRAEQEAAERVLRAAEERAVEARTKQERDDAARATHAARREANKRRKATEATAKADAAAKRTPITFDARCAQLFKLDSHAETFRKIVTGETFQSYLPVSQQFKFAKEVLAAIREHLGKGQDITAERIKSECWSRIETGLGMPKGDMRTAPERPYLQEIRDGLNFIRRAASDYRRGVALLLDAGRKGEQLDAKQQAALDKLHAEFERGIAALAPIRDARKLQLIEGWGGRTND